MTAPIEWIVERTRDLPRDERLRKAAAAAQAAGGEVSLVVARPPQLNGHPPRAVREVLVVGLRAACVRLGRVEWGRWDAARELIYLDRGIVVDPAGRSLQHW